MAVSLTTFLPGRIRNTLELWTRKVIGHFRQTSAGHTSRSMEDSGAEGDLNCGGLAQEVSEENFNMLPRDHSCEILVKNVAALCPCPKRKRIFKTIFFSKTTFKVLAQTMAAVLLRQKH